MAFRPYPIVPFSVGLEKDKASFLLEDDAFPTLNDCYLYQGRITRRIGNESICEKYGIFSNAVYTPFGVGATTYSGNLANIVVQPSTVVITIRDIQPGLDVVVYSFTDDGFGNLSAGIGTSGTVSYTSGAFTINFPALAAPTLVYVISMTYGSYNTRNVGRLVQRQTGFLAAIFGQIYQGNIFTTFPLIPTLGIQPGSVTVYIGPPIGNVWYTDPTGSGILVDTLGNWHGTIDYSSGALTFNFGAGALSPCTITFSYFTGRPVMGLRTRETTTLNRECLIAFDTQKANLFNAGTRRFDDISFDLVGTEVSWTGTDSQFFWSTNYYVDSNNNKLFWATNNKQYSIALGVKRDGIQIYNGTGWEAQNPQLNTPPSANRYLNGCLMLVPYRNRMVALNTLESTAVSGVAATRYPQRARWSQNGVPYTNVIPGAIANAWSDDTPGLGGYNDAPTSEEIVACGFYKDILIVFFERSTWALVYSGDYSIPFYWQRINMQFGCESTFSTVGFDKGVFAVGDKGIVVSDSVNVERIDQKIPLEVFDFHNQNEGPVRVYGIRDYFYQFVYWIFPNDNENRIFPNRILALNYKEGSYSIYYDRYTCLGYFQRVSDRTWASSTFPWMAAVGTWSSGWAQADFPSIVAGDQQGFVVLIDQKNDNDPILYITNITQALQAVITSPNHNLEVGDYVLFSGIEGMLELNGLVGKVVSRINDNSFSVDINTATMAAYVRGGYIKYINNIEIVTKRFNPFFGTGKSTRANYLDIFMERTSSGAFTVEFYTDYTNTDPIFTATVESIQNYGPTIATEKMWQRVYVDVKGQFVQVKFTLSESQIRIPSPLGYVPADSCFSDIIIHAMNLWMAEAGRLFSFDEYI